MNPCAVLHRVTILALSLAASPLWPGEAASTTSFELLGSVELPPGTRFEDEPVGGLSGLVWEPSSGHFLALSDDPSERAPARLYELAIDLDDGRLGDGDVSIVRRIRLLDAEGRVFERGALDPEGLALTPAGEVFIGSEGVASSGAPPFIARFGRDGREVERLALDARYLPDGEERRGVRRNLGFESLTVVPDGTLLVSGVENALAQDGAAADVETPSPARLLVRSIGSSTPLREYVYEVGAVAQTPPSDDSFRVNGLVDLAALSGDRFLALEREYVAGMSERVLLYEIDLAGATQVSALESLAGASGIVPVRKRLLLDFAELGVELDNFEAIALGPALADGRRVLVALSDDNFNPAEQRTRLVALALDGREPSIAAIQGAAHRSPLAGRWIAGLSGVVTAVDERARPPAFYLQSERADADPATSEAIRVAVERGALPGAGSRVLVGGRVEERAANAKQLPVTTLVLSSFETLEASVALPAPVRLGVDRAVPGRIDGDSLAEFRPERDALDFWESLESMLVELPGGVVSGPTLGYGELVLAPAESGGAPSTAAGGLALTPAGPSLERTIVSGRLAGGLPQLAVGARVAGPIAGVLDYSFSNYKLLASAPLRVAAQGVDCPRATRLAPLAGHLTVATSNVENLSAADPEERFARAGRVLAIELRGPAIVALEEIQDDSGRAKGDGIVTSQETLARLVRAVVAAGGPSYESLVIDPELDREGGVPGGNIRVALLYDPARVGFERRGAAGPLDAAEPVGRAESLHLTPNPGRVAPASSAFTLASGEGVRRSLAVELRVDGRALFVIANHWSSKFDDDRAFGAVQPPAAPTGAKRLAQARVIRDFVERLLEADPEARVVVLGDLNDLPWSEPIEWISAPPLVNLVAGIPAQERYTYNFEGMSQAIDFVLVSPSLAAGAEIEALHRNSDCPESLRSSDHDPLVARLAIGEAPSAPPR